MRVTVELLVSSVQRQCDALFHSETAMLLALDIADDAALTAAIQHCIEGDKTKGNRPDDVHEMGKCDGSKHNARSDAGHIPWVIC